MGEEGKKLRKQERKIKSRESRVNIRKRKINKTYFHWTSLKIFIIVIL